MLTKNERIRTMLTKKLSLLAVVVIAGLVAFRATEVKAQLLAPGLDAPLTCTAQIGSGSSVTVQAGKTASGDVPYPLDVPCPGGSGTCSEWNLKFTYGGGSPNHSFASISSDLDLFACSPSCSVENPVGAGDSTTKIGEFLYEQRTVRFNSTASVSFAQFVTEKSAPRVASAGGRVGTKHNTCLIAGAGGISVGDPNAVIAVSTVYQPIPSASAICPIEVIRDAAGLIVQVVLATGADPGCVLTTGVVGDVVIGGLPVEYIGTGSGDDQELVIIGNTQSCQRYTFNGKLVTVDPPPNPPKCQ